MQNAVIFNNMVFLNDRLGQAKNSTPFVIPANNTLIITDIIIQNRAAGDAPVPTTQFSRVTFSTLTDNIGGGSFFLTVVGNETLNLHLRTGVPFQHTPNIQPPQHVLQVQNAPNSTAPFIEYVITGFLMPSTEK